MSLSAWIMLILSWGAILIVSAYAVFKTLRYDRAADTPKAS
jgi:hypothetical protein